MSKIFIKKFGILLLIQSCGLVGCIAWNPSMISAKNDPITPKLLQLESRMATPQATTSSFFDDQWKLFAEEVATNLVESSRDRFGYIELKTEALIGKQGVLFLTTPASDHFDLPSTSRRVRGHALKVEIRILNRKEEPIAKYVANGFAAVPASYLGGYTPKDASRKSNLDALDDAFSKIRPQIQADAQRVNEKLLAAGKL